MCVNNIIVTDGDIHYAERLLFKDDSKFDDNRKNFIKNFETCDLHAVPGCGKTTLLLAKLLIIERYLPLRDGRGVLVISHTNTAVDEITKFIARYCPKLFSEPNFIGTIQSFVNKFLAIPYYENVKHCKIIKIDDILYNQKVEEFYNNLNNNRSLKTWLSRQYNALEFLKSLRFDKNFNLTNGLSCLASDFKLKDKNSSTYKALKRMKIMLLNKGILHYDDAYTLAFRYIEKYPLIIEILRTKFKYIFVDEMQDMDYHQYQLLEKIFYGSDNVDTVYQRIGDNNQAIYSNIVKSNNVWKSREDILTVNGSHRLKRSNADLVSRFALDGSIIEGLNKKYEDIKPILYVYDNESCKCKVIKRFVSDLENIFTTMNLQDQELIVKVISWRKSSDDLEHKISLQSYCPEAYNNKLVKNKEIDITDSFGTIYSYILEYIISILINSKVNIDGNLPTKTRLINYIKENENLDIERFKLNMYEWCLSILNNDYEECNKSINNYITFLMNNLGIENIKIECSIDDIVSSKENITESNEYCEGCYVFNNRVEICSAHSVKGETHDATLFLESFYNGKYESDILSRVLKGESVKKIINQMKANIIELENEIEKLKVNGKRGVIGRGEQISKIHSKIKKIKEYTKLVFVGLSRSRNIIAYGMDIERYNKYMKNDMEEVNNIWDIRFIK